MQDLLKIEQEKLQKKQKLIKENDQKIEQIFDKIKACFTEVSNINIIYNKTNTQTSFYMKFPTSDISFRCFLSKQATQANITEYISRDKTVNTANSHNTNSFKAFAEEAIKIANGRDNLTNEILLDALLEFRKLLIKSRKLSKEQKEIKDQIELFGKSEEFNFLNRIFTPVGDFCVYTDLAKELSVELDSDTPSRIEKKVIIEAMKRKNYEKNYLFKKYTKTHVEILPVKVYIYNGKLSGFCYYESINSIKKLNECLSQQVKFLGKIITKNNYSFLTDKFESFSVSTYNYDNEISKITARLSSLLEEELDKQILYNNVSNF